MPPKTPKVTKLPTVDRYRLIEEATHDFMEAIHWKRSVKGNYSRVWDGRRVTVFKQRNHWGWCFNSQVPEIETEYNDEMFETLQDAKFDLGEVLGAFDVPELLEVFDDY